MRTSCIRVLMLAALFSIFTAAASLAQTLPMSEAPQVPTKAEFLASLAGDLNALPGGETLTPSPKLLSTTCDSHDDCPTGQLCCYPCGIPDCEFVCMTPWRNRCPPIP